MANKSILLVVADPQALADIAQMLAPRWEATPVSSESEAVEQLGKRSFDALLVDFNLGSPDDGSELLNHALERCPETVRFLFAHEADLALVAAKVLEPYQILPKPIEWDSLEKRLENGLAPEDSRCNQNSQDLAGDANAIPASPSIYTEVLNAINTLGTTNADVGDIIARDEALTRELVELTHSAYLGLHGDITDPAEAVESLGLEVVKALVMALQFLNEHRKLKPGYLSFNQVWRHSTNVARMARDLVLFETKDRTLASETLIAGLLHDLGKVVLVTNFGDLYGRVHSLGRKQPVPIWEIEKEIFGANHGEIGGCLIGMWNMPRSVVEAAALHHEPPTGEHEHLDALTAVHIANVLEHEIRPNKEGFVAPIINTTLLNELGLLHRLPVWRATVAKGKFADPESELELTEAIPVRSTAPPPRSGNQLSGPATPTRTTSSGEASPHAASHNRQMRWVYAGAAATLLILLSLWSGTQPEPNLPVYARTPAKDEAPVVLASTPAPETAPTAAPDAAVSEVPKEQPPTTVSSATVPEPVISQPEPEPTPPVAPQAVVTSFSTRSVKKAPEDFRLYGVIYSKARPSAIVNGETVCVGDYVNGAIVISIGRTNVTLQIDGQRKTYTVR